MPYKDFSHCLYELKLTESMTSDSGSVMFTERKQWNEAPSFHRTPKHLSIWQDVEGTGKSRRQWRMTEAVCTFPPPPPKLLSSSASSLLYFISLTAKVLKDSLSHTNMQRSLAHWYNSVSSETLLAYAPPWLVRCEMQWVNWPFNLPWHSFLALNTRGMVSSRSMADWGGQPQKSKVTTGGVPRRQGRLSGVSREVCPNPVLPPLLPADSGLPAFITQL